MVIIIELTLLQTSSKAYKQPEFAVSRRYRDFLWLYTSLHNNNPGVVVPPPPEKQVVGRFDSNFVESRRSALERMLNKTAAHPILQHDADLKIFLESDAFNMDVKHREHKEPGLGESKGMFSSIGFGSAGSGKFIEHDDWFHDRKIYLDALETQLKALLKAIDTVVSQRKTLAEAAGDFSASLHALSTVELSVSLSAPLEGLSDLQLRIRELYERQAQQDVLTLGMTVDEYIRLIASIKMAFVQRQKSFHSWHSAEGELSKRKSTQEKVLRSGKTQQDRLNQLQADVGEGERRCHQAKLLFEDMGRLMRAELERFEREKVEDFKSGVETFLEGAIEAQKEVTPVFPSFPHIPSVRFSFHFPFWGPLIFPKLVHNPSQSTDVLNPFPQKTAHRALGNLPYATRRRRGRRALFQTPRHHPFALSTASTVPDRIAKPNDRGSRWRRPGERACGGRDCDGGAGRVIVKGTKGRRSCT